MPRTIRLAAATLNTTPLDWVGNTQKILKLIKEAQEARVHVLCLPELCISGYGCEDMFLAPDTCGRAYHILVNEILPATRGLLVCVGLPVAYKGAIYNTVATLQNQELLAFHAKAHLAGDGVHYETRWFKPWPQGVKDTVLGTPIGDLMINAGGVRIGYEICEDAWVAERPGHHLAQEGVDIILNPSASHFAFGKVETRKRFVMEGARAFHCAYVYANLAGNESGRTVYDGDCMIAASGKMLGQGPRFPQTDTQMVTADVKLSLLRANQAASASRKIHAGPNQAIIQGDHLLETSLPPQQNPEPEAWEASQWIKEEEFTRAIAMALRDYKRKSGTKGFVVSLSGGADSAAVCALIHYMAGLAPNDGKIEDILTTIYQGSHQSSDTTRNAAAGLAAEIGASHHCVDVSGIIDSYVGIYAKAVGRTPTWETDDIALQNIQARVRGPMAWMLANTENKLLLSTSNRSEAAVGYATMDGDTCGALSPIAGIDKTFVRKWLVWAETTGPDGLGPIPSLDAINRQKPTAELRPEQDGQVQTDEEDLMPYPVLGEIENLLIRDKLSPDETFEMLQEQFPGYQSEILRGWITKFQILWRRNQWKRERYAPAFHVDDKNLDPRSWCRYPLLTGPV